MAHSELRKSDVPDITLVLMLKIHAYLRATALTLLLIGTLSATGHSRTPNDSCGQTRISVSVVDESWSPVMDLKAQDFQAEYKKRPIQIIGLVPDERPRRVAILLDASGSIGEGDYAPGPWRLGVALASDLARNRIKNVRYALFIFNKSIIEEVDFSNDDSAVSRKLSEIQADAGFRKAHVNSRTALWDAAAAAARTFTDPTAADILYAVTDGGDNQSSLTADKLQRQLAAAGVRFSGCLIVAPSHNRTKTPEELEGGRALIETANYTGGLVFGPILSDGQRFQIPILAKSKISNQAALTNSYRSLLSGYRMDLELTGNIAKPSDLKLELTKQKSLQLKNAFVSYGHEPQPCDVARITKKD